MPRLLGTFRDSWTLDCVCDECNRFFGENLEVHFGRDSTEALHRLQHGIKKPSESADLPYKRITVTIDEGPLEGARATIGPDAGEGVQPLPLPQVGFRHREALTPFRWLLETELTDEGVGPYRTPGWQIRVIGGEEADRHRLLARIRALGVAFKEQVSGELSVHNEHNQVAIVMEALLDIAIQRTLAKIAMNFAAYVVRAEFVRDAGFDAARQFIRHEARPGFQVVTPSDSPILVDDSVQYRQTKSHLIVIGWEGESVVVRFSPFNFITYRIILAPRFEGLWQPIAAGFLFDHERHSIHKLTNAGRLVYSARRSSLMNWRD